MKREIEIDRERVCECECVCGCDRERLWVRERYSKQNAIYLVEMPELVCNQKQTGMFFVKVHEKESKDLYRKVDSMKELKT